MKIGHYSHSNVPGMSKMLLDEGCDVSCYWKLDKPKLWTGSDYNGLQRVYPTKYAAEPHLDIRDWCQNQDLIFMDYNDIDTNHIMAIRASGVPYVGPSIYGDRLELDRAFGKSVIRGIDHLVIPGGGWTFHDKASLMAFLESIDRPVVIKARDQTLLPHSIEEAKFIVSSDQFQLFPGGHSVYVEEKIYGIEVAFGRYLRHDGQWHPGWVITQEYKGACNGNRGSVLTAETGTVIHFVEDREVPACIRATFEAMRVDLATSNYRGFFDINTIHDGTNFNFLEFTTRPGYPTELEVGNAILQSGQSYADFLGNLAGLEGVPEVDLLALPRYGVVAAIYAQGLGHAIKFTGRPVLIEHGILPHNARLIPNDCIFDEQGRPLSGGTDRGAYIAGYADSVDEARRVAYEGLSTVHCYGHTWRDDIGVDWDDRLLAAPVVLCHDHVPRKRRFQWRYVDLTDMKPLDRAQIAAKMAHVEISANWRNPKAAWNYYDFANMLKRKDGVFSIYLLESIDKDRVVEGFFVLQESKVTSKPVLLYILALSRSQQGGRRGRDAMAQVLVEAAATGRTHLAARCADGLIPFYERNGMQLDKREKDNNRMVAKL